MTTENKSITISKPTLAILKNFASISGNILLQKDEEYLKIMSPLKNLYGHAKISERFPQEFSILELSSFIEMLRLFDNDEIVLTFEGDYVIISNPSGTSGFKFYQADKKFLQVNEKPYKELPAKETFSLPCQVLQSIQRADAIIGGGENVLMIKGENGKLNAIVSDKKDRSNVATNNFKSELGKTEHTFEILIKTENLKVMPRDYTGHIVLDPTTNQPRVLRLIDNDGSLIYTIAVEVNSTYEK